MARTGDAGGAFRDPRGVDAREGRPPDGQRMAQIVETFSDEFRIVTPG
jgi:hypothetical protein